MKYAPALGVGDSKSIALLVSDASGSCSADFGLGIPIGALAVALSGGAVPPWAAGLSAGIYYTSSSSLDVYGGIQNYGEWNGIGQEFQNTFTWVPASIRIMWGHVTHRFRLVFTSFF